MAAFDILFSQLNEKLCARIAKRYGLRYQDVEEIISGVFFEVHQTVAKSYNPSKGKLTTWIFDIAKKRAIDHIRWLNSPRQQFLSTSYSLDSTASQNICEVSQCLFVPPSQGHSGKEDEAASPGKRRAQRALDSLDERDKNILRLRQLMTYEEIAEIEKTPVNTLRSDYSRAKMRLFTAFEKDNDP